MTAIAGLGKQVLLIILDGFGINPKSPKNAISAAKTPNITKLFENYPYITIEGSGEAVGLPKGVYGNSEVGHLNIGAGRPVRQDLLRINEAIANDTLKDMPKLLELVQEAKSGSKRIHLMGLLSDGGVHAHIEHIKAIISAIKKHDSTLDIFFHAFMDGRDTPIDSGIKYVEDLTKFGGFTFASMQGRSIGMDRDKRYEKIEIGYNTLIGKGNIKKISPREYVQEEYSKKIFDEFITPCLFDKKYAVEKNDALFFLNFRPDRAIEITQAFTLPEFKEFKRDVIPKYYLCMSPYIQDELDLPILFDKEELEGSVSEYLSKKGLKQFKTAETEKFAHITFFFNGGKKAPFKNEDRLLVPSPREVKTYDQKPQMSAYEVTDGLLKKLDDKSYSFYLVNFANADMVGHTGNFQAAVKAVEAVDECVGRIMEKCLANNIPFILTADHGNADQMEYENGSPHTAHTTASVPFVICHNSLKNVKLKQLVSDAALKDISPTLLTILGLELPEIFVGRPIF